MIFKSLFANDGLVNRVLSTVGIPTDVKGLLEEILEE